MDPPSEERQTQQYSSFPEQALKALAEKNIPVVEYGAQISLRHGLHLVLLRLEWVVPDELLSLSSQILSECGAPCIPPATMDSPYYGPWQEVGFIHQSGFPPIHLYPLSITGLALQDTYEVPCIFEPSLGILTPKAHPYVVSLIHHLLIRPVGDAFRYRFQDDLLSFIIFYVLDYKPLDSKDWDRFEDESDEEFQERVENAVTKIRSWDWETDQDNYRDLAESITRDCDSISNLCG